jgi:hypothetical protein
LQISRTLYLECAHLRRRICYAFADVGVGDAAHLPENGVPTEIVEEAIHLPEARHFEATFESVSKIGDPSAKFPADAASAETEGDDAEDQGVEEQPAQEDSHHNRVAVENLDDGGLEKRRRPCSTNAA